MERHLKLVAILNIVYRGLMIFGSIFLFLIAAIFGRIMDFLERRGELHADDIPREILDLIPIILVIIGTIIFIVSIAGILGAVGLMRKQEWGRILVIVVSFFNLVHIPLGTALGVYSLWVLLNDEIVRIFHPLPEPPPGQTTH
jgi:Trk-type K+ transport system membrane component